MGKVDVENSTSSVYDSINLKNNDSVFPGEPVITTGTQNTPYPTYKNGAPTVPLGPYIDIAPYPSENQRWAYFIAKGVVIGMLIATFLLLFHAIIRRHIVIIT